MIKTITLLLLSSSLLNTPLLFPYDEILLYRPPLFSGTAQIARNGLSSVAISLNHGEASRYYSPSHKTPSVLQPSLHNTTLFDSQNQLFSLTEVIIRWYQNLQHGLFVNGYIPLRSIGLYHTPPKRERYSKTMYKDVALQGVGDVACAGGWTLNYEDTTYIDFVDATVQMGGTIPTSTRNPWPQTLPESYLGLGYNGLSSLFAIGDMAIGCFDWLTYGAHLQISVFPHKDCICAFYNTPTQGPYNAQTYVARSPGTVFTTYCKADHVILGLSITVGYSFVCQGHERWIAYDQSSFILYPVWKMHVIHTVIEYDAATYENPHAPAISFTYDAPIRGTGIIPTKLAGGTWNFTMLITF